jgi:hypothetical protein
MACIRRTLLTKPKLEIQEEPGQCNESSGSAQGADMEHTQTRPIVFAHSANNDATIDSICKS